MPNSSQNSAASRNSWTAPRLARLGKIEDVAGQRAGNRQTFIVIPNVLS
jgi:hypothetical protein